MLTIKLILIVIDGCGVSTDKSAVSSRCCLLVSNTFIISNMKRLYQRLLRCSVLAVLILLFSYTFYRLQYRQTREDEKTDKKPHPVVVPTVKVHKKQLVLRFGKMRHFGSRGREFDFRLKVDFKPSNCSISIQNKLQRSKWASKMYLPNITMVMHEGAMSNDEYRRLHAFGMPYGLSFRDDLVYTDLQAILSKLPRVDSILDFSGKERPSCLSCAVVGNGGILNGSKLGKEIDEHDLVFRVNHAIRRGFEEDVGTRTTHYVMMDRSLEHTSKEDVPRDQGIIYVFLPCRRLDYDYIEAAIGPPNPNMKLVTSANNMRILHPDFVRYVNKVWIQRKRAFRPTTGGIMFMSALHSGCDSVNAYGMGFNKQYTSHYYDIEYRPHKSTASHDFGREIDILKILDKEGIINWYKRDVKQFYS